MKLLLLDPGEKIPLDGVIVRGGSTVNQAPITGESMLVTKRVGDEDYAGTINNEGFLEIKVTKKSDETILSKIVRLVEEAQRMKSPTERFINKFSKYYTPSVILLAMCVAVIPTFIFGLSFSEWFYKALVLLVASCPCALAISTPSTYVEEVNKIRVFAFDKTGTLTEGKLEVADIISLGHSEDEITCIAASLEALSEQPIAKAIVKEARKRRIALKPVRGFRAIAGKGVTGEINSEVYYVGSRRLFEEFSADSPEGQALNLEMEGKTVVFVGNERGGY